MRPADVHLVKRLKEICEIEGLKADNRSLGALVSIAKGDLRGCLNTLQVNLTSISWLALTLRSSSKRGTRT